MEARCPIERLRRRLVDEGIAMEAELKSIDDEVESQALEAIAFAEKSAWPDPATATDHVYATPAAGDGRIPIRNDAPREGPQVRETTYMKATLEALSEAMERNPRIFVMGEGAASAAAISPRRLASMTGMVQSGSATRRSASAALSAWPRARP